MPPHAQNDYAAGFLLLWQSLCPDLPAPEREFRFAPPRRWRFDLAWPAMKVAVEIEGLTPGGGRHQRVDGYAADCQKYRAAVLVGWAVLRYATPELKADPIGAVEEVADLLRRQLATVAQSGD